MTYEKRMEEIEEREKKASKPTNDCNQDTWWYAEDGYGNCCPHGDVPGCDHRGYVKKMGLGPWYAKYPNMSVYDASFICNARYDIPWLLAEVKRLRELCSDVRDTLIDYYDGAPDSGTLWMGDLIRRLE